MVSLSLNDLCDRRGSSNVIVPAFDGSEANEAQDCFARCDQRKLGAPQCSHKRSKESAYWLGLAAIDQTACGGERWVLVRLGRPDTSQIVRIEKVA